jgi:glycosyltransferase involved in cell wall biosynthesis
MKHTLKTKDVCQNSQNSIYGSIVIGARHLPTYYGGLSQYQRALVEHLADRYAIPGEFLAAGLSSGEQRLLQIPGWGSAHFEADTKWKSKSQWLMKLASKPPLHGLAEKIIVNHWHPILEKLLPQETAAIHFVGTGWDLFGFALLAMARRRGARFTIWPAVHPMQWGDDIIDLRLYKQADSVFCQTDHEKNWLIDKGLPAAKAVRCGLPPMCLTTGDAGKFRRRHGLADRPLVLFMGRKDEGKGYPALLQAWQSIRAQFPRACLIAIGPSPLPGNSIGKEQDGVLDLGIVSEEEKADALAACDIFCLPSAHESFGIVYLEAWSYAKPVICGTAPACRELILDHEDGLWSSQKVEELSASITSLLSNPARAVEMGQKGLQKQRSHFTWETVGLAHLHAFFG